MSLLQNLSKSKESSINSNNFEVNSKIIENRKADWEQPEKIDSVSMDFNIKPPTSSNKTNYETYGKTEGDSDLETPGISIKKVATDFRT